MECPSRLLAQLEAEGLAVADGFWPGPDVRALSRCLGRRRAAGHLNPARIGPPPAAQRISAVRGDLTCWLAAPLFAAERRLLAGLERLRLQLNREAWLGLEELELHYAVYPVGARYCRHVDQPRGRTQRRVSLVLYLNPSWGAADGGELRIFDRGGGHRDIAPIGGRLVCFLSADREHEVLAAGRERSSISGWFHVRG